MSTQIVLDQETYKVFLRNISLLKDLCTDINIVGGFIRQRTNSVSAIFEIDLSEMLGDVEMRLPTLKQKIDLLEIFQDSDEVTIEITDEAYLFSDEFSKLEFLKPRTDWMMNPYITTEELNSMFNLLPEDQILSWQITEQMSFRIDRIAKNFNISSLIFTFSGESALVECSTQAKDQSAVVMRDIVTDKVLNCFSSLPIIPFVIDHDGEIEFKMFNDSDEKCTNRASAYVGDVKVVVYSKSALRES